MSESIKCKECFTRQTWTSAIWKPECCGVFENKDLDTNRHQAALTHSTSHTLDLNVYMCVLYVTMTKMKCLKGAAENKSETFKCCIMLRRFRVLRDSIFLFESVLILVPGIFVLVLSDYYWLSVSYVCFTMINKLWYSCSPSLLTFIMSIWHHNFVFTLNKNWDSEYTQFSGYFCWF